MSCSGESLFKVPGNASRGMQEMGMGIKSEDEKAGTQLPFFDVVCLLKCGKQLCIYLMSPIFHCTVPYAS